MELRIESLHMDMYDKRAFTGKIIMTVITLLIIAGVVVLVLFFKDVNTATMKILSTEGVVIIEDKDGNASFFSGDTTLSSGEAVSTGVDSLASVAIDNDKTVTLEASSRVCLIKSKGVSEIDLTNGGLFFEVNRSLRSGESMTIKTGSLVISVNLTSGYLHTEENGTTYLTLTTGYAHITDGSSEVDIQAGQKVTFQGSEYTVETVAETDLNDFVLHYLLDRWELRETICRQTGWDNNTLIILGGGQIENEPDISGTSETEESGTDETSEATPTPRPTSTPSPTPTPVVYQDPAYVEPVPGEVIPEQGPAEEPAPEQTEAPAPEQTEAPAPEQTEAPAPDQTEAPAPDQTETPEQTEAPAENPEPQEQPADNPEAA